MAIKKIIPFLIVILTITITKDTYSLSTAVKTKKDYIFALDTLRDLYIVIENFGTEETIDKYKNIKSLFQEASENLFGLNYSISFQQFRQIKTKLIDLLEILSKSYLERTKQIIDATSKDTFEIIIEYSKKSPLAHFFRKPFDPYFDIKPYDPQKYHYFHDREKFESYLNLGNKNYNIAKNIFNDPEIEVTKKRKHLPSKSLNFIIDRYLSVIKFCRESKMYGIEIYKLKNHNKLGESMIKYKIHSGKLLPIFDGRIPDEYKVDANDNLKLIHSIEQKKLNKVQN